MDKRLFLLVMLSLILFSISVDALGVTPGRKTFDFSPGATQTVEFSILTPDEKAVTLAVMVQGGLADFVTLPQELIRVSAQETERKMSYTLSLPDDLGPGLHKAEIVVVQLPDTFVDAGDASVGAAVGVATQLHVHVPYPGKYAEAGISVVTEAEGVTFVVPVVSRGQSDLVSVQAVIDIYSSLNTKVATVTTNEVAIPGLERKELVAEWVPEVPAGKYRAVVSVLADEQSLTLETQFDAGRRVLDLLQVEVNEFKLGDIAKFELLVENSWSKEIEGVVAQTEVSSDAGVLAEFSSASYTVPPLSKALLVSFWDTAGVPEGDYDASVLLKYGEQTVREDFELAVASNSIRAVGLGYVIAPDSGGAGSMTVILATVIGVLVLINALWFLVLRKRLHQ